MISDFSTGLSARPISCYACHLQEFVLQGQRPSECFPWPLLVLGLELSPCDGDTFGIIEFMEVQRRSIKNPLNQPGTNLVFKTGFLGLRWQSKSWSDQGSSANAKSGTNYGLHPNQIGCFGPFNATGFGTSWAFVQVPVFFVKKRRSESQWCGEWCQTTFFEPWGGREERSKLEPSSSCQCWCPAWYMQLHCWLLAEGEAPKVAIDRFGGRAVLSSPFLAIFEFWNTIDWTWRAQNLWLIIKCWLHEKSI